MPRARSTSSVPTRPLSSTSLASWFGPAELLPPVSISHCSPPEPIESKAYSPELVSLRFRLVGRKGAWGKEGLAALLLSDLDDPKVSARRSFPGLALRD